MEGGVLKGGSHQGANSLAVVLLCSGSLNAALGAIVSQLQRKNLQVEVVRGVDQNSELARAVAARYGDAALYVFCRDSELQYFGIESLKSSMLAAGEISENRLITISARTRNASSDASALVIKARLLGRSLSPDVARAPPAKAPPKAAARSSRLTPASIAPSGGFEDEGVETRDLVPPNSDTHAILDAATESFEDPEDLLGFVQGRDSRRKKGIAALIVGVALATAAALLIPEGDDSIAHGAAAPTGDQVSPEELVARAQSKVAAEPEARSATRKKTALEASAKKTALDVAYRAERATAAAAPSPKKLKAKASEDDSDDELVLEELAEEMVEEMVEDVTDDETKLIDRALSARKLRAFDMLIVDPRRSRRGTFAKANAHCAEKHAYGITGWRLPTVGEIATLVSSGIVGRDRYWSVTDADLIGARKLVFDGKKRRIRDFSTAYSGALGICIRQRHAAISHLVENAWVERRD